MTRPIRSTPHRAASEPLGRLKILAAALLLWPTACAPSGAPTPDGIYAEVHTNKGLIVGRLEHERTPMTVASFVGLAEGTIENAAFEEGTPFYDGTVYTRVVPGHVIQTGIPISDRADGPGYTFPNEIHAELDHGRAGMFNMANGGPHTNAGQFTITLGDRSYLDGDYIVFGQVVEGLDVVMDIVQGDVIDSVRIVRVGSAAQDYRPGTEEFHALVRAAEARVAEHEQRKARLEDEWVAERWPEAGTFRGGPTTVTRTGGADDAGPTSPGAPLRVRYEGIQLRYRGAAEGWPGPDLQTMVFASGEDGLPGFREAPVSFDFVPGSTVVNPGLDQVLAEMVPGETRVVIVPPEWGYGSGGLYLPEIPGEPRFVISPDVLLVYEVEALPPGGS